MRGPPSDLAVLGASHVSRSGEDPTSNPTDLGTTSLQHPTSTRAAGTPKYRKGRSGTSSKSLSEVHTTTLHSEEPDILGAYGQWIQVKRSCIIRAEHPGHNGNRSGTCGTPRL
jgi:hypothetical protein